MNLGFIGAGNMATAIIKGIVLKDPAVKIFVIDKIKSAEETLNKNYGALVVENYDKLISNVDVLILAIKPNGFSELLKEIGPIVKKYSPLLVSIAAGQSLTAIEEMLGFKTAVIRVMPNINAEIMESMTAICSNKESTAEHEGIVKNCFEAIGKVVAIEESYFPIFTAIASCSPAFTYLFIDSLAKGAQKLGMNKKEAIQIAAQTVLGSAKMILQSQEHPQVHIDKVCSPGGTTIAGVCTLEDYRFESAIVHAVEACVNKDTLIKNSK